MITHNEMMSVIATEAHEAISQVTPDAPKFSHCFPYCRERGETSTIAYCGHFDDKPELFDAPEGGEPCPICMEMHELREKLDKYELA